VSGKGQLPVMLGLCGLAACPDPPGVPSGPLGVSPDPPLCPPVLVVSLCPPVLLVSLLIPPRPPSSLLA
jgi:hypothetical protein